LNRRSLVSLKLENGLTDLDIYFFLLFVLVQGWFKKEKKIGKVARKLENSDKLKVLFSVGTAGTIWLIFVF
jgi:hypothetical protein